MAKLKESDQLHVDAQRCKDNFEKDSARPPKEQCKNCGSRAFNKHGRRLRWFLPVIENMVRPIRCVLHRWLCVNCSVTFIHINSFGVRYKRYLRNDIEARASAYTETDSMSYRRVVKERGAAISYDDPIAQADSADSMKEEENVRELAPSTVHRWIGAIAAHREQWQAAVRQAQQICPDARLRSIMISAVKYRSTARKRVLEACGLLLRALEIVSFRNPTKFATLGSSP